MTTATATTTAPRPTTAAGRLLTLTRMNARLLTRNRLTLSYAFVMPLLPLLLALAGGGEPTDTQVVSTVGACLMTALLFSAYYSALSLTVTRRDELVLKRLRTGEATDREIVGAMLLPGIAIVVGVTVLVALIGPLFDIPLPDNPALVLAGALVAAVCFAVLGLWTAAWTPTAEAAQLTCLPVFMLGFAGLFFELMPDAVARVAEYTPGAAVVSLMDAGWVGGDANVVSALLVLVAWTFAAVALAQRGMRWEPRA